MATGFAGIAVTAGWWTPCVVDLLEEAPQSSGGGGLCMKAKVLGRLALELYWLPGAEERRGALSQLAVEMARRVGDAAGARLLRLQCPTRCVVGTGERDTPDSMTPPRLSS
jgi:hypothetical protein